jgi:gas vesicle protein GvpL/GvpF
MATYLYCLRSDAAAAPPPPGLEGIDGAAVYAIESAGLVAWVSDLSSVVSPTVERVKAHDQVCAAAMSLGETPLPIRFGQTFADDSSIVAAIESRASTLRRRLTRVAGCVELRLVVTKGRDTDVNQTPHVSSAENRPFVAETGSDPTRPGTAFLRRLARAGRDDLAREVGCEGARHAVRAIAKSLVVDQQPCESARGMAFFPVLVRRPDVDRFRAAVAEWLSTQPIDLSVLGPFAPYSFAGDA